MAWALVQSKVTNGKSATFDSSVTVGNLLVVCPVWYNGTLSAVGDGSNTYAIDVQKKATAQPVQAAVCSSVAGTGGTLTVTITCDGNYHRVAIMEFSGNAASSVLDSTATGDPGSTTSPATGSCAVNQSGSIVIGAVAHAGSNRTITQHASYSLGVENEDTAANIPVNASYIAEVASAQTPSWTIGTGAVTCVCVAASYKPGAAAAVSHGGLLLRGVG